MKLLRYCLLGLAVVCLVPAAAFLAVICYVSWENILVFFPLWLIYFIPGAMFLGVAKLVRHELDKRDQKHDQGLVSGSDGEYKSAACVARVTHGRETGP